MPFLQHDFACESALLEYLVPAIAARLHHGIESRGRAVLIVSGGRSPIGLFKRLGAESLDWARVTVTLADERWVPEDHADANARLVREHLLKGPAAAAQFLPLSTTAPGPHGEETRLNESLAKLDWPADAILLGMGEDGHTASLFPGAPELALALAGKDSSGNAASRCCAITPPEAEHRRMTLTLPALLDCDLLVLQLFGREKRRVLEEAMQEGPVSALPVRALLHQAEKTLSIYSSDRQ